MTNREWLLEKMQNMSDEEFATELEDVCRENANICKIMNEKCEDIGDCTDCLKCWLQMEHKEKITLSEAERIILENIDKDYKIVGKTENGTLFAQKENGMMYHFDVFNGQIFAFMETGRFYYISELLKGE